MKNVFLATLLATLSLNASANCNPPPPLNEVTFRLNAEEWVQTSTAKLIVEIHATLDKKTLSQMRTQIMTNLNKIAVGNWHITDFERSQDNSGLEKLYVVAEARVSELRLTNVNTEAEALSEPGVKYKVQAIDFSPSMADIERAKTDLRRKIYHDAETEIATINSVYTTQKYVLHDIQFGEFSTSNAPGVRAMPMVMMAGGNPNAQQGSDVVNSVSNLIKLTAEVNIASAGIEPSQKS